MQGSFKFGWVVAAFLFFVAYGSLDTFSALAAGKKPEAAVKGTLAQAVTEAQAAGTATLSGKVSVSGSLPAPQKIKMAADPVCTQQHSADVFSQDVVANNGALQYATVYIKEGAQGAFPASATPVVLDQQGCMYSPPVFALQAGQPLEIRNSDPTLHNVNCQAAGNKKFNLAQPTKGMKTTKTFDKPEMGIPFKCNVHPWMAAHGSVFAHPFFAVTGADGSYSIQGLPAGAYTVEVWHAKLGAATQQVTVADGESKSVDFQLQAK